MQFLEVSLGDPMCEREQMIPEGRVRTGIVRSGPQRGGSVETKSDLLVILVCSHGGSAVFRDPHGPFVVTLPGGENLYGRAGGPEDRFAFFRPRDRVLRAREATASLKSNQLESLGESSIFFFSTVLPKCDNLQPSMI